ncbi:MAG: hypothetical protein M1380_12210 [Chloroflexi bacterium]|nr:hypothetical protein [Chloroflexota bacterium]
MSKNLEDQSVERMLERFRQGLLTKQELDDFLELERRRNEVREKAIEAGRLPGKALEEK